MSLLSLTNAKRKLSMASLVLVLMAGTVSGICSPVSLAASVSAVTITNLKVESTATPLGIDVEKPTFSWQMAVSSDVRGYAQTAYQIIVKDSEDQVVWDSDKVASGVSVGISYAGDALRAATKYTWTVTVWDQNGDAAAGTSWFETGLMNSELSAWNGATWIGGGQEDMVLYAHSLSVFKVKYSIKLDSGSNSTKAGFVLGANDSRLMDKNKNMYNIQSGKDQNYLKFELDISAVDGSANGLAKFNIYRAGYAPGDSSDTPLNSGTIPLALINKDNKYDNTIFIWRKTLSNA
ncbi:hypothetical protein M3223_08520 [Paenibacillus pasadenensis]|uniref:glycoside hydrolase family 78 protein n=1 Tax=Paenibacillus pasadenensis TaxID=217090 RepID=UPI00203F4647|nr:hypothetical protein [Paenibacillus pasadenensis]MCM3747397.1 hypothetical protein [Paenibacillus pasadenensis]